MNRKTCGKSIPGFLLLLFLTTIVVTSFHYQTDPITKPDCATCKVASDLSSSDATHVFQVTHSQCVADLIHPEIVNKYQTSFEIPHHSRAPPALVRL